MIYWLRHTTRPPPTLAASLYPVTDLHNVAVLLTCLLSLTRNPLTSPPPRPVLSRLPPSPVVTTTAVRDKAIAFMVTGRVLSVRARHHQCST